MNQSNSVSFVRRLAFAASVFVFGMVGTAFVMWLNRWLIESMGVAPTNAVAGLAVVGMFVGTLVVTVATLTGKFDASISALKAA